MGLTGTHKCVRDRQASMFVGNAKIKIANKVTRTFIVLTFKILAEYLY
jgi:hypothetical protein